MTQSVLSIKTFFLHFFNKNQKLFRKMIRPLFRLDSARRRPCSHRQWLEITAYFFVHTQTNNIDLIYLILIKKEVSLSYNAQKSWKQVSEYALEKQYCESYANSRFESINGTVYCLILCASNLKQYFVPILKRKEWRATFPLRSY